MTIQAKPEISLVGALLWLFKRLIDIPGEILSLSVVPVGEMDSQGMALTIRAAIEGEVSGGVQSLSVEQTTQVLDLGGADLSPIGIFLVPVLVELIDEELTHLMGEGSYAAAYVPFGSYIFFVCATDEEKALAAVIALAGNHARGMNWVNTD